MSPQTNNPQNTGENEALTALVNLHPQISKHLFSTETGQKYLNLLASYQISSAIAPDSDYNDVEILNSIVGDVDLGLLKLSELVPELVREMYWSEEKARKFACDLAGYRYLPIADLLKTDVASQIKVWGSDNVQKIFLDKFLDLIIKELTQEVLIPENIISRFRFLLTSRIKGVRDDLELKTLLVRPEKIGGTELFEEDADFIIDYLKSKLTEFEILGDITPPPPPPTEKPKKEEALPAAKKFVVQPLTPRQAQGVNERQAQDIKEEIETEEEEIEEIKEITTELSERLPPPPIDPQKIIDSSTENIVRTSGLRIDPNLKTRFKNIVAARLRDLRDANETKNLISSPLDKGGLNLAPEKVATIANLIEAEFLAIQKQLGAEKKQEAAFFTSSQQKTKRADEIQTEKSEKEALDRRYLETIKKSRTLQQKKPITPPSLAPAPKPQTPSTPLREYQKKSTPVLSPASVPPTQQTKPIIEDIKFARKTLGPIDELRALTLTEFRRLSKDPKEATMKIHDKIELLKDQSYEKYTQAVRAWQESELNKNYLELTRSALSNGKPVADIIKEKTDASVPTLTLSEFQSILALNSELRF